MKILVLVSGGVDSGTCLGKADIIKEGLSIGVPYEYTWSCYESGSKPCGKCGTCIARKEAFEKNGIKDPAL